MQSRQTSLKLYNVPRVGPTWRAPTTLCITRKSARRCGGGSFGGTAITFRDRYLSDIYLDQVSCSWNYFLVVLLNRIRTIFDFFFFSFNKREHRPIFFEALETRLKIVKRETRNIHGVFEGSEKRMIEKQGARGHCLSWLKASAILYECSVGCPARTFLGIRLPSRRSIILRFRRMKNAEIAATTSSFSTPLSPFDRSAYLMET